ncbi:MAG: ribonuclease H-like domain-containing protein [Candidatus Bathyarchaeota archaeon]|nr:MAG: ribonuclease H-like domain-containing protein [Candidatus Bathyarchaeota archaeon]
MYFDLEASGLNIITNKILTIQIKDGYGKKVWCLRDFKSETGLIRQFVDYYLDVPDKFLIGYNFTNLDLPLMFRRMAEEDLPRFFHKYNRGFVRDIAMILEFHKVKRQKMRDIAEMYNIEVRNEDVDIPELYLKGDWDNIKKYAENELDTLEQLWLKIWSQIKQFGYLKETLGIKLSI